MSTTIQDLARASSTTNPESLVAEVIGETGEFLESKEGTWFRRALPLILRFGFNQPVLGSVFGIVNLYYGLGKSIIGTHREVRKKAKYWGFVYTMQWGFAQMGPNQVWARQRFLPGKALMDLKGRSLYSNQQLGAIEVNKKTFRAEFESGVQDAIGMYNELFAKIEQAVAQHHMHMVANGASAADRKAAYHLSASKLRYIGARGMYQEVTANLPPRHIKALITG